MEHNEYVKPLHFADLIMELFISVSFEKRNNNNNNSIFLIISHRAFPQENKTGGGKKRGSEGGRVIHSVSLAYEKRLTTI